MDQTRPTRSRGKVPFSWENKPGVAKNFQEGHDHDHLMAMKLPPPPCPNGACKWTPTRRDIRNIPLPPAAFRPPPPPPALRSSSSGKGHKNQDDPFLAAYQECTKSTVFHGNINKVPRARSGGVVPGLRRVLVSSLSCKSSCGVRDGNLVRVSHLPLREWANL